LERVDPLGVHTRAAGILLALTVVLSGPVAGASADGPVGVDPSSNFLVGALPAACQNAPTGATCIAASVGYLNQARASLGQPAYTLPSDFASLTPGQQALELADSDRALYGLPPVAGLVDALDRDAAAGVLSDADPVPSDSNWLGYTSNWAGGYENILLAYEAWMYDDGPGSGNLDCTPSDPGGCWAHRHDILWRFDGGGPLAMGAAAGEDSTGQPGYAMLIEEASPSTTPSYVYTWSNLAPAPVSAPAAPAPVSALSPSTDSPGRGHSAHTARLAIRIATVRTLPRRLAVTFGPSGGVVRCSLTGLGNHTARVRRVKACARRVTFADLPRGRYRLRVSSPSSTVTRRIFVP
jgi:hypothetical protein